MSGPLVPPPTPWCSLDELVKKMAQNGGIVSWKTAQWKKMFQHAGAKEAEDIPNFTKEQWQSVGTLPENVKKSLMAIFPDLVIPRSEAEEIQDQERAVQAACPHNNLVESSQDPSVCLTIYEVDKPSLFF